MAIILKGVDPTTFNLIASILAEILQLAGAYTLCAFTHWMVSLFVRNGKKIPAQTLGCVPDGLIAAFHYAHAMGWAWPSSIALILFISDYSTTIAFAGLGFVQVDQAGPQAPVFNLAKVNDFFPYEAIGDPLLPFTASRLEMLLATASISSEEQQDEILKLASEEVMVGSFLGAAESIAQGRSIFLEQSTELVNDPTLLVVGQENDEVFPNITESTVIFSENSFLVSINLEIPVECSDDVTKAIEEQWDHGSLMTDIQEYRGPDDWTVLSSVPDCTFTSTRASGIYGFHHDPTRGSAEITAYVRVSAGAQAQLMINDQLVDDISTFVFPFKGLYVAREINDFREGRQVHGFGGVLIGGTYIPFESTVVSSGRSLADPPQALDPEDQNTLRTREYTLVSKVKDEQQNCPSDPSGNGNTTCLVTVKVTCETFGSEIGFGGFLNGFGRSDGSPEISTQIEHNCVFDGGIEIIWGRNYNISKQLLATVAGIHARNSGWALSLRQKRTLSIHSIPAALFTLGTLDSRASVEQVSSTTIDTIFIFFMLVPVGLCVITGCIYILGLRNLLPIPDDSGTILELGVDIARHTDKEKKDIMADIFNHGFKWKGNHLSLDCFIDDNQDPYQLSQSENDLVTNRKTSPMEEIVFLDPLDESPSHGSKDIPSGSDDIKSQAAAESGEGSGLQLGIGFFGIDLDGSYSDDKLRLLSDPKNKASRPETDLSTRPCEEHVIDGDDQRDDEQHTGSDRSSSHQPTCDQADKPTSYSMLLFTGTVIYVAGCMLFSTAVAVLGAGYIGSKRVGSIATQALQPAPILPGVDLVEKRCFRNNHELRSSIAGYAQGPLQLQTEIVEQYGPFEEWCVDYVDDFSFAFADLPRQSRLNASNWNVSGATKFAFTFYNFDFSEEALDVSNWDVSRAQFLRGMFYNATSFKANLSQWDVSSVTDFSWMFSHAISFNSDISRWDVSSGTDFSWMFKEAWAFDPDLSLWDVSSGIYFDGMFFDGRNFQSNISLWNVSSGTSFHSMFQQAYSFDSDVSHWNVSSGVDFSHMFDQARRMKSDLHEWDVSSGTDFAWMFNDASSFNGNISPWDVSSGNTFESMFRRTPYFNSDLSQWNVSSGVTFESMFFDAQGFNSNISQWDVSSATNFQFMFSGAAVFNSDLSRWDVSSGINFREMFKRAIIFNGNLSLWDVSSGTDFSFMFDYAESFTSDLSQWDVSSGTDFDQMFYEASRFTSDLSHWDVSSATNFQLMFSGARAFMSNLSQWDVSSVTSFHGMFHRASAFTSDLSYWDVSSGTDFSIMFFEASTFTSDLSNWDVSSGNSFRAMFNKALRFNSNISNWDVSSGNEFAGMFSEALSFNSDLSHWDVSSGTNFESMFALATSFTSDLSPWDVSSGKSFHAMFLQASAFNSDLSRWDVSTGTDFSGMFYEASAFNSDLAQWDVSLGTKFNHMFYETIGFNSDLSKWDVSSGSSFRSMFFRVLSFKSDLSKWDVSSSVDFSYMFYETTDFNSDLSKWDVSSSASFNSMFYGAGSFNSDLSKWDVASSADFSYMFLGAGSFNSDLAKWDVSSGASFNLMFYNAVSFNQNLCDWNEHLLPIATTSHMFWASACPHLEASPDHMCHNCSPTPSPSSVPSQSSTSSSFPSVSASPTIIPKAEFTVGVEELIPIPRYGTSGSQYIPISIDSDQYDCQIADIDVSIQIQHEHSDDLEVALLHPDGNFVWLFSDVGGTSALNTVKNITLDDEAPTNIRETIYETRPIGTPEYDTLSKFDGKCTLGTWNLYIFDDAGKDTGVVYSIHLHVTCAAPQNGAQWCCTCRR